MPSTGSARGRSSASAKPRACRTSSITPSGRSRTAASGSPRAAARRGRRAAALRERRAPNLGHGKRTPRRLDLQRLPRPRGHHVAGHQQGPGAATEERAADLQRQGRPDDGGGLSPLSRPPGSDLDRHGQRPEPLRERRVLDRGPEAARPELTARGHLARPRDVGAVAVGRPQGPPVGRCGRRHLHRRQGHAARCPAPGHTSTPSKAIGTATSGPPQSRRAALPRRSARRHD